MINKTDIAKAIFNLGRRSPTERYLDIAIEISFLSEFIEEPPKGLCATFYRTLSYDEDLKRHNRLKQLVEKFK